MKKKCVIGVGSPFYHDDGVGIYLLEQLQKHTDTALKEYDFIDGGTGGLNLLHYFDQYKKILVIDAVSFNEKPGKLLFFSATDVESKNLQVRMSTHFQDILRVLSIADRLNKHKNLIVIAGIQPADLTFGYGFSETLTNNLEYIKKKIISYLRKW